MGGNSHNSTCAVSHENKVGYKNRNFVTIKGVDAVSSGKNTFFFCLFFIALLLFFANNSLCKSTYFISLWIVLQEGVEKWMFGSNGHKGDPKDGVGSGSEDRKFFITPFNVKIAL